MFLVQHWSFKFKNVFKRPGGQKDDQEEQDEAKAEITHQKILCICLSIAYHNQALRRINYVNIVSGIVSMLSFLKRPDGLS